MHKCKMQIHWCNESTVLCNTLFLIRCTQESRVIIVKHFINVFFYLSFINKLKYIRKGYVCFFDLLKVKKKDIGGGVNIIYYKNYRQVRVFIQKIKLHIKSVQNVLYSYPVAWSLCWIVQISILSCNYELQSIFVRKRRKKVLGGCRNNILQIYS